MIKTRFAPSPTGFLHIGGAQSALYNYLFAKKNNGAFCLRIEDTDKIRSSKKYEESILEALAWLGLEWDGEIVYQSKRAIVYKDVIKKLLNENRAFYCHHTLAELDAERQYQEKNQEPPRHLCSHKNSDLGKTAGGIIRINIDLFENDLISFNDMIRGKIEFRTSLLGDFSIARSIDNVLYNLAVVIDDSDMMISHVIRGEDHISNTPKQLLIYQALQRPAPEFAHLPLLLSYNRAKLSKRDGAIAVIDYKTDYLPDSLINFLGTLSHSFSKDIISLDEMAHEFDISKVHKSGAIFDVKKLDWMNAQYVRKLPLDEFNRMTGMNASERSLPLIVERLERLGDVGKFHYLDPSDEPTYSRDLLRWKKFTLADSVESLKRTRAIVESGDPANKDGMRNQFDALAHELGDKGLVYWPYRVALTGEKASADPIDITSCLDRPTILSRIDRAIEKITS